jgi:hypothetical protein
VTCEGHYDLAFLYHIWFLRKFIGFHLNVPFYLLIILYKMSKRYKRQSLESSLFHHDLIKILLIHHLTIVGDYWDGFLTRNGFSMTILVERPNSGESYIKNSLTFQTLLI